MQNKLIRNTARNFLDLLLAPIVRFGVPNCEIETPFRMFGQPHHHTFIGYYDIQPFNRDNSKLLAGRCSSNHNSRAMNMPLEIGYFDLKTGGFTVLSSTDLWCWQMGCRLQWINWSGEELILFNSQFNGNPCTVIFDPIKNEIRKKLFFPTYAINQFATKIVSLDFDNLERCRKGYGYDFKLGGARATEATLDIHDLKTEMAIELVSSQSLRSINYQSSMDDEGTFHYFNHVHFNPSGSRILFFHIWNTRNRRYVRALTINPDGSEIRDVTGCNHVSHYWWLNDHEILLYCSHLKFGLGFYVYNQNGQFVRRLDKNIPSLDGHPCSHQHPWFVSDSVVNKNFERDLWLYNLKTENRVSLAKFFSPPRFSGSIRCDLHPRLSQDGRFIAVDSAHTGHRQIIVLDISSVL